MGIPMSQTLGFMAQIIKMTSIISQFHHGIFLMSSHAIQRKNSKGPKRITQPDRYEK